MWVLSSIPSNKGDRTVKSIILLLILMAFGAGTLYLVPMIHEWEQANKYPYGKLCDVMNNCTRR